MRYCPARAEMTIVVLCPPTVTITCIGNAPSGTAVAAKILVLGLNDNQAGSASPATVVTWTVTFTSVPVLFTCCGNGKLKPLPAVAISFGTETVMMPPSFRLATRCTEIEIPASPDGPAEALLAAATGAGVLGAAGTGALGVTGTGTLGAAGSGVLGAAGSGALGVTVVGTVGVSLAGGANGAGVLAVGLGKVGGAITGGTGGSGLMVSVPFAVVKS